MSEIEQVLKFVEASVYTTRGEHLQDLQRIILRESWQESKKTYQEMAREYNYSVNYIKQVAGPRLWKILSQALGEKVTKSNLHSVLERQMLAQTDKSAVRQEKSLNETSPLPALEFPEDSVPLNSSFYIERVPDESRCYREIVNPGAFIRIKAPRQMGKTSLMNRILAHARKQNYRTGLLHFQQVEAAILTDLNRLLRWFCANLTRQLNLESQLNEYWDEELGAKMSCTFYLQEYLLEQIESPLVLALEEINTIIEHPEIAREFLTLVRFWHEKTKTDPSWQKVRLIMVHSTEIYLPLDINQSPLNVGLRIELKPFGDEQVRDLAQRHGLTFNSSQLERLTSLLAGHPYLVRLAFYYLALEENNLETLLDTAPTDAGIYSNHLHRYLRNLQEHPELAEAYHYVLQSESPIVLEQVQGFKLHSMGLVNLEGNKVTVSCNLYRQYFSDRLI